MAKSPKQSVKTKEKPAKHKWVVRTVKPDSMEEGECIEGKLLDIQEGKLSDILCIKVDGVGIKRIWSSTVLANAINRLDIGKYVKITYKGEEQSSAGRDVKIYDVLVEDTE